MILESIDEIEGDSTMTITVKRDGEMITMSIDKILPSKLLWRVSILPYGCEEHIARSELSTFVHNRNPLKALWHINCVQGMHVMQDFDRNFSDDVSC